MFRAHLSDPRLAGDVPLPIVDQDAKAQFTRGLVLMNGGKTEDAVKAFKAKGVTPIAMNGKDMWSLGILIQDIILKTTGARAAVYDALDRKTWRVVGRLLDGTTLALQHHFAEPPDRRIVLYDEHTAGMRFRFVHVACGGKAGSVAASRAPAGL